MSEAAAFDAALRKLGAPTAIQQEFHALAPGKRLAAFLGKPISLFPTNLTLCAWSTLLFGPAVISMIPRSGTPTRGSDP